MAGNAELRSITRFCAHCKEFGEELSYQDIRRLVHLKNIASIAGDKTEENKQGIKETTTETRK